VTGSSARDERFRRLYAEHFEPIRAYCLRRLPVHEANDAVAEVFVTAWHKAEAIPMDDARPLIFGIARNVVLHSKRSLARRARVHAKVAGFAADPTAGPETETLEHAESQLIRQAVDSLPERDREVLRLKVWEELTAAQIAVVIGASVAATEKRIARAYRKFERALGRSAPEMTESRSRKGGER